MQVFSCRECLIRRLLLMGSVRPRPVRLGEKLRQIRLSFGLYQSEMLRRLDPEDLIVYSQIAGYELAHREPSLLIPLRCPRIAGVPTEVPIDDEPDLPAKL